MPRVITVPVYTYEELAPAAQARALGDWAGSVDFPWTSDYREELSHIEETLGVSITYELDTGYYYSHYSWDRQTKWDRGLTLQAAQKFTSRGFCAGEGFWDTFKELFKGTGSARVALDGALSAFFKEWVDDLEHYFSEEGFKEHLECIWDSGFVFSQHGEFIGA